MNVQFLCIQTERTVCKSNMYDLQTKPTIFMKCIWNVQHLIERMCIFHFRTVINCLKISFH